MTTVTITYNPFQQFFHTDKLHRIGYTVLKFDLTKLTTFSRSSLQSVLQEEQHVKTATCQKY